MSEVYLNSVEVKKFAALVQIPLCREPPLVISHQLLSRLRIGCLVVSPLRIACVILHGGEAEAQSEYGIVTENCLPSGPL
jgi:hypothetical protein